MTRNLNYAVMALLGALAVGITLALWGQPLICTCGEVKLWVGSIWASGNSQHIADWYTLSHFLHGVLIVLIGRLLFPRITFPVLFAAAIVTGVGWEIIEHTEWVLGQFRATNVNQGYFGDSVLNAVSDYLWMLCGFFLANSVRLSASVVAVVALELTASLIARDSLTLSTLMLVHPLESVAKWQQALKPPSPESAMIEGS